MGEPSSDRTSPFASLRLPAYRALWFSGLFTFLGVQMQVVLRGILAWDLTESPAALGTVLLGFGLAMLIATPLGGVAADRLSKRAILVTTQSVLTASALGISVALLVGVAAFWMLVAASVAQGAAFGFFGPARMAYTRELVGREQVGNAISLAMLSMNSSRVVAPSVAGALAGVAAIGVGGAYLFSAALSVTALGLLFRLGAVPAPHRQAARNPIAELVDGFRYVAGHRRLRLLMGTSFIVIVFGFNYVSFLPALILGELRMGNGALGLAMSIGAVGAVVVALPIARRADTAAAGTIMIAAGVLFGGSVVALALAPTFLSALVAVAVAGAATTTYQSLSNTLALGLTDDGIEGRVQSLLMLSFAGFGIAARPLGALAEVIGLRPTMVLMGSVTTLAAVAFVVGSRVLDATDGPTRARPGVRLDAPAPLAPVATR
jgi:predicted MFS family arabinose efflux permease